MKKLFSILSPLSQPVEGADFLGFIDTVSPEILVSRAAVSKFLHNLFQHDGGKDGAKGVQLKMKAYWNGEDSMPSVSKSALSITAGGTWSGGQDDKEMIVIQTEVNLGITVHYIVRPASRRMRSKLFCLRGPNPKL
jgi:hypothetical protein